jgi:FkbM family methyltransferase
MNSPEPFWMRIPVVRGWIARLRSRRERRRLLDAYQVFRTCAKLDTVDEVRFDAAGCVFALRDGRRFFFDPARAAGWLYSVPFSGTFERKETDCLKRMIRPGWTCLDVGACFGWYTVLLSRLAGERGAVHAFEPVTPNRECLESNLALNACRNVIVSASALGENAGRVAMFLPRDAVSASLQPHADRADCERLEADVTTLDAYTAAAGITRLDFLKADVEGAELLLLKGGIDTLRKFKPVLMLEVQARSTLLFGYEPRALFSLLAELGYEAFTVSPDAVLVPYRGSGAAPMPDYNFVFQSAGTAA